MPSQGTNVSTPAEWRSAAHAKRLADAKSLALPSGVTILAARPAPLEWILAGRLPQRLLSAALRAEEPGATAPPRELSREAVVELARFAADLVRASVVEPAVGEGPGEIRFEDIPIEDRTFIFEWACRALRESGTKEGPSNSPTGELERFCAK